MLTPLTLKQRSKAKFDTCKGFTGYDFLQVVFTFPGTRTCNKGDIGPL